MSTPGDQDQPSFNTLHGRRRQHQSEVPSEAELQEKEREHRLIPDAVLSKGKSQGALQSPVMPLEQTRVSSKNRRANQKECDGK